MAFCFLVTLRTCPVYRRNTVQTILFAGQDQPRPTVLSPVGLVLALALTDYLCSSSGIIDRQQLLEHEALFLEVVKSIEMVMFHTVHVALEKELAAVAGTELGLLTAGGPKVCRVAAERARLKHCCYAAAALMKNLQLLLRFLLSVQLCPAISSSPSSDLHSFPTTVLRVSNFLFVRLLLAFFAPVCFYEYCFVVRAHE